MTCKFVSIDQPRVLSGRHTEDCEWDTQRTGFECRGCAPCTEPHCRVCGKTHAEQTCPACAGEARDDLHTIGRLTGNLAPEAKHRGVNSEAMKLLLPAADPEAWGHITTSLRVGRLPHGYLVCDRCDNPWPCDRHADTELHPLFVLGNWDAIWREALDHAEPPEQLTIATAGRYLDTQLTYMAGWEHSDFDDFARDLRKCRTHLESVLHDQNQGDRANVGCFECGGDLERKLCATGFEDQWTCRQCKQTYTPGQYNFALRAKLEQSA